MMSSAAAFAAVKSVGKAKLTLRVRLRCTPLENRYVAVRLVFEKIRCSTPAIRAWVLLASTLLQAGKADASDSAELLGDEVA